MANREVNLTKRVQNPHGMRYCPVVLSANDRAKPHLVRVKGRPERYPEGGYYLEWREGARRIRLSVGKDTADATSAFSELESRRYSSVDSGDMIFNTGS